MEFDPRAWNLLAGLALVNGCGERASSTDGAPTESSSESGPECIAHADCPPGYLCNQGECWYPLSLDDYSSDPYYSPCRTDADCEMLELCEYSDCDSVYTFAPCDAIPSLLPPFEISEPVLALAFVDVDDDAAEELVVATQTQLHVFESGSPMPVSHARGSESLGVHAMVGGAFDDVPGEDVMLLHFDQLDLHVSDGLGNLAPAIEMQSPYPDSRGLEPGSFDGQPTTDLLIWGEVSTGVRYGGGGTLGLLGGNVTSASARDLGLPGNGFTALRDGELLFVDIGGLTPFVLGTVSLYGDLPHAQTRFDGFGETLELGSSQVAGWTLVQAFDRASASLLTQWGFPGTVTHMRTGELDGLDEVEDIALLVDDGLVLLVGGACQLPVPLEGAAGELVFGDHDGDGDDELAARVGTNLVSIVDVE